MALVTYILGDCPGCGGKKTFGNIDVYETYVSRGCKVCRYKSGFPLPVIKKKVIYLDQFFFSHAFRGNDERFMTAAELIRDLANKQLIVAPYSSIHEEETHQWERFAELMEFIKAASRGHEFEPAYDVERVQVAKGFDAFLKDGPAERPVEPRDALQRDVHVWESYFRIDVGHYLGDRELIRELKAESVKDLIDIFPAWRASNSTFEEDLQSEHRAGAKGYLETYGTYMQRLNSGDFAALIDSPISAMVIEYLLHYLPHDQPYPEKLTRIIQYLNSEHFQRTPYQDLSARLFATLKILVKGGAYANANKALARLSGFFHDVKHIATYAPYCDAFVMDQPMAELVAKPTVDLENRFRTRVFSLSNWDDFIGWLEGLRTAMPAWHSDALREAYPS